MFEQGETYASRAKFGLQVDRTSETWEFIRELDAKKEMTVRCTLNHADGEDWTFTGPAREAIFALRKHQRKNHKHLARRSKPQRRAAAPARP